MEDGIARKKGETLEARKATILEFMMGCKREDFTRRNRMSAHVIWRLRTA